MNNQTKIGDLDAKIGIYKTTKVKTTSGATESTEVLHRELLAHRQDRASNEREDGKILLYQVRNYTVRYYQDLVLDGEEMYVKDFDGIYRITGLEMIGRKKFLVLKTLKRE